MNKITQVFVDQSFSVENLLGLVEINHFSFFLDSSDHHHLKSRYSYFGMNPSKVISGDKFEEIDFGLFDLTLKFDQTVDFFLGGWMGFLSYECNFLVGANLKANEPGFWFGYYDWVLVVDHQLKNQFFVSVKLNQFDLENKFIELKQLVKKLKPSLNSQQKFELKFPDKDRYQKNICKIKKYLKEGDVYQINYTENFEFKGKVSSASLYLSLREKSKVPYGAYLNLKNFEILSMSPECFFERKRNLIQTIPIKGTVKRDLDLKKDQENKKWLKESDKIKAELLMIIDLERNDLGKICKPGSIKVDPLFKIETYQYVHHLMGVVQGILKDKVGYEQIFQALFPGGSVTGAPKLRAMEIINELENYPRSVYTGALGFIGYGGVSTFNLPIRTVIKKQDSIFHPAGGGIVIDSDVEEEYQEMLDKVRVLLELI